LHGLNRKEDKTRKRGFWREVIGMQVGAMNDPHAPLYKELEWVGKSGFDFVDFTVEPEYAEPDQINVQKARKIMKKYGLGIVGHMGDWKLPKDSVYKSIRESTKNEIVDAIRVLKRLGAKKITIHSPLQEVRSFKQSYVCNKILMRQLLKEARKQKVMLMMENDTHSLGTAGNRRLFNNLLRDFPALRVHIDVGHANLYVKSNITSLYLKKYGKRVAHMHFSDNYGKDDNHLELGKGRIAWSRIIKSLKRYKYDGTITVETFRSGRSGQVRSMKKLRKWWAMY
jgi:sugar phosphate isomerase/epimerase